jgi:glycosyltransferase involved in cell wall biosynthesis/spore maturation protein CgeB
MTANTARPWRILLLDTKRSNPNHYLCIALREELAAHPQVDRVVAAGYGEAVHRAQAEQCNLFIAFDGEEMHRETCARLAAVCGRSLLWVTEDPYEVGVNVANGALFDLVFSNDSASLARYGAKGRHLPLAASPLLHRLEVRADGDCRYDLFFAGTAWPNRVALLKRMMGELDGIKLKLALPHNEHLPKPDLPLPPSSYSWRTPNNQFVRFANASRVVLSLHREFTAAADGAPMAATPGPRLFEVALAGGFQLVDLALDETRRYFDEGREFIGFNNDGEAIEQLRHYLAHPEERIAIARAAQAKALAVHTYAQRAEVLLAEAATLPARPMAPAAPATTSHRLRVLQVTHNIVGVPPYGGVEVYQDMMAKQLAAEVECYFYVPDRSVDGSICRLYVQDADGYREIEALRFSGPSTQDALTCPERERAFAGLLGKYGIEVVHFQHFIGHVPSLPYIARALGVATMMSLHDYYPVCSQFNLIGADGRFCQAETRSEAECDICLRHIRQAQPGSQACRRAFFGRLLQHIDVLQANTSEVVDRYRAIFPALAAHPQFEAMGVPSTDLARQAAPPALAKPLRVALIGNFSHNKGGEMLFDVFEAMRDDPVRFEIFGSVEAVLAHRVAALNLPNVVWHGGYTPGTLAERLDGIGLSLHSSIWPETYCLALSEAWQVGLVPLVADIGALGLRVEEGVNGFKYPHDRPGALVDRLRQLVAEPERVAAAKGNIHAGLWTSLPEHGRWLAARYAALAARSAPTGLLSEAAQFGAAPTLADCGVVLNYPLWRRTATPIPQPATALPALHHRAIGYLRRHGAAATARRMAHELRRRLRARLGA